MPRYESSQTVITFIRRLNAPFTGFSSQMIPMEDGMTQMLLGQMTYIENKIAIAVFTRPADRQDCIVLSRPLFHIPDSGLIELFEQLLFWNNGATEMVHFAIDEPLNTINLVCFRTMEGMSFQEFQRCLENIVVVARNCSKRLQPEFGLMRLA
jgi:hypothetical protein